MTVDSTNHLNKYTPKENITDSELSSSTQADEKNIDHVVIDGDEVYAGMHLLIDVWADQGLNDLRLMENALREAVKVAKATLLHIHLHHFTCTGGISGVAVLAESHISVHSWPERQYAAFDVFMCGQTEPHKTIEVFERYFKPRKIEVKTIKRGRL